MTTQHIKNEKQGWVGFDLDGTLVPHCTTEQVLAHYIGEEPFAEMVQLIHKHKAEGYKIKIFTARVSIGSTYNLTEDAIARRQHFVHLARAAIQAYCLIYFGEEFEVTCEKDFNCVRIYDDRARHVVCDTGRVCCAI